MILLFKYYKFRVNVDKFGITILTRISIRIIKLEFIFEKRNNKALPSPTTKLLVYLNSRKKLWVTVLMFFLCKSTEK